MNNKIIKNNNLLSIEDAERLDIEQVHKLYRTYVNNSQVDLISKFGFGNDISLYSEGIFIYTKLGKKIYDFTGGIGVLNHGHNHKRILEVRKKFSENKRMEVHKNFFSPYVAALSNNIANLLPEDLNISYFSNSGSDANEGALKLAFKYHEGKRDYALNSNISFHGKKIAASNITSSKETRYFRFQQSLKSEQFEYNNIESVKKKINNLRKNNESNIYAIIVEPFSASSLLSCSEYFLKELKEICQKENIVLIFDEVYSGWSKTGELFYFMNFENLVPDIVTSAKSLGGGKASISAYTCRDIFFKKAYDNLRDATLHSTTFNGLGEETATAIEAINIIIEDNYVKKSKEIFNILNTGLINLKDKYPKIIREVRGSGSLNGIIINTDFTDKYFQPLLSLIPGKFTKDDYAIKKIIVSSIISALYDSHNILTFYGSNVDLPLKISPPVIATKDDLNYFLQSLENVLDEGLNKAIFNFLKKNIFK
jgi:putrescine aminotransferase